MYQKRKQPSSHSVLVQKSFQQLYDYIKNSGKFEFTLEELKNALKPHSCITRTLMKHLHEQFQDDILIVQKVGTQPVVYYKAVNLSEVATNFFNNEDSLTDLQKQTVVTIAARILKKTISETKYETDIYPQSSEFVSCIKENIPPLLNTFLQETLDIVNKDKKDKSENQFNKIKERRVKLETIAHSMICLLQPPKFTSMLQLSVGTYVFRKTGSKLIIELLSKIGISCSYYQIRKYEDSVIMYPLKLIVEPGVFVQFVFDNTDHNVATLDGKDTFHCLGVIAIYTPEYGVDYEGGWLKSLKRN